MREIKFRGYDKEFKKMTYFDDEEYDYRPPLAFRLDQAFKKDSNYDDYEDFEYKDITEKLEIMQYTGLKDKNEKEIYEGDIVEIIAIKQFAQKEDEHEKVKGTIVFEQGEFLVKNSNSAFGPAYYHLRLCKEIEKIGNIYDNPELLKDKSGKELER